jgi:hypothetical protein
VYRIAVAAVILAAQPGCSSCGSPARPACGRGARGAHPASLLPPGIRPGSRPLLPPAQRLGGDLAGTRGDVALRRRRLNAAGSRRSVVLRRRPDHHGGRDRVLRRNPEDPRDHDQWQDPTARCSPSTTMALMGLVPVDGRSAVGRPS